MSPIWLLSIYLVQTVGELFLSPVGLSVTAKLAQAKYGSRMMGVWFLSVTAGNCVTSLLGLANVDLSGGWGRAAEAMLAGIAGLGIFRYRRRITAFTNG